MRTLSDIGERGLIEIIQRVISKGYEAVGIGDDCAAFKLDDIYLLISTDMVTRSTHLPSQMTPWEVGWFTAAVTLSDIAAKGGDPLGMVLSLGLPLDTSEDFLVDMMRGADACVRKYNTSIVGGDTKEDKELTLCGTAIGVVPQVEFMSRRGIEVGDIVAVTGSLGKAAAGFLSLQKNVEDERFRRGLFKPEPRLREGRRLAKTRLVHSCMDISDGLSASLYQLMEINDLGFEIDSSKIPLADTLLEITEDSRVDALNYALHFGGDYELLLVIPPDALPILQRELSFTGTPLTEIGVARKDRKILLSGKDGSTILENLGYEHFKSHFTYR